MLTKEDIAKFEEQHGDVVHCKGPLIETTKDVPAHAAWEIVLKRPGSRKFYKVFRAMANNDKQAADANEFLIRNGDMLVYPKVEAIDALLDQHFGVCESSAVQKAIKHLCGLESEETGKL